MEGLVQTGSPRDREKKLSGEKGVGAGGRETMVSVADGKVRDQF